MKQLAPFAIAFGLICDAALAETDLINRLAPALAAYDTTVVDGDLWQRPGLSPRDRSVVTVATLIARGQIALMPEEFARALDNGVTPAELSEIITHLAFYSGWGNAAAAVSVAAPFYESRGIDDLMLDILTDTVPRPARR